MALENSTRLINVLLVCIFIVDKKLEQYKECYKNCDIVVTRKSFEAKLLLLRKHLKLCPLKIETG